MGAPVHGEVLAGRYRLEEPRPHTTEDGHSLWRGTDTLLNRTVAIEMQIPGGKAAKPLIDAAVTAGGINHPGVIGVYDAVNEPGRAFVVREWAEGSTLTELISEGVLPPGRAATVMRGVADAVAGIHAINFPHAALNPDCVLIDEDGDVTITGLKLTANGELEQDVRAMGGLLYAALTGHWPTELGVHPTLPDAIRVDGRICSPRQVRAGIPPYLDALTMDLLDPAVAAPPARELAAELHRYDVTDPELSALTAFETAPPAHRAWWRRLLVPAIAVTCIVAAGIAIGTIGMPVFSTNDIPITNDPTKNESVEGSTLSATAVSVLDPEGDGAETSGYELTTDGDPNTSWETDGYNSADFGGIKSGMGIVIDLGSIQTVRGLEAELTTSGANVELRGSSILGTEKDEFEAIGKPAQNAEQNVSFSLKKPFSGRYLLLWFYGLPESSSGNYDYSVGVHEIRVTGDKD
ncbi:MAG: hypothetical protein HOQ05_05815 [Corynebacteriales bacterium]|nr:hypothetical protein [Mycobacteriales bacterium]